MLLVENEFGCVLGGVCVLAVAYTSSESSCGA